MRIRLSRRGLIVFLAVILALWLFGLRTQHAATQPGIPPTSRPGPATTTTAPATTEEGRHDVYVGIYINQIKSIDIKTNQFVVDFWIWFRWKGEAIDPLKNFEVIGGEISSKEHESTEEKLGWKWAQARVLVTITQNFDIARFPLDQHTLKIEIEDSLADQDDLVFKVDQDEKKKITSGLTDGLEVPGWKITNNNAEILTNTYATNYGDPTLLANSKSEFSRFSFKLDIERPGVGYFFKLFWSLFLATVIALLAMLIDPIDLDPRFGLGVGAIFAAIASAYVISSALPETNQYTLADKMNMLAVGLIFASILQSVFSLRLWKDGKESASKRLDFLCFWSMLGIYLIANILIVVV